MKTVAKILAVVFVFSLVLACFGLPVHAAAEERTLVTAITPEAPGNVPDSAVSMPAGWAGMKITVGENDLHVTALGRWYTPESNATHNFLIANMDGSLVLDYGRAVTNAPAGAAEGFVYAPIEGGVVLSAHTSYYIVSDYWGAADKFYSGGVATTTDAATIDGIVIGTYEFYAAPGICWGPLDLKYTVEVPDPTDPPATEPAPTDPPATEPVPTDPPATEPVPTDPPVTEPAPTEPEAPVTVEKPLVESVTPDTPGNVEGSAISMPAGWAGMKITIGDKDVHVTALGRWYTPESNTTHNFLIANMDGSLVLDYGVAVANAPAGTAEGFVYAAIDGGVTLKANTSYYIISDYWGDRDKFYAGGAAVTSDAATIDGVVILVGDEYQFTAAPGTGWGPLDLIYAEEENPKTGDGTIGAAVFCGLIAVGGLAVIVKKKPE
ncbi:MAG: hypothetical protein E7436_01790 [Ruminococcaceae bacterium]|nr:hypothetical protein [Oscillospiraceae bacterium]